MILSEFPTWPAGPQESVDIESAISYMKEMRAICDTDNGFVPRAYDLAINALRRAQPANEPCADCTGIMYRQTASGRIIPADRKCAVMEPPLCYQPDGDGCAYQIYGDNDDEPIDRCKACPLCYSDKMRHKQPANEPLTLDELRGMEVPCPLYKEETPSGDMTESAIEPVLFKGIHCGKEERACWVTCEAHHANLRIEHIAKGEIKFYRWPPEGRE